MRSPRHAASDRPVIAAIKQALARFDQGDARMWALVQRGDNAGAQKLVSGAQNAASDAPMAAFSAARRHATATVAGETASFNATASRAKLSMISSAGQLNELVARLRLAAGGERGQG